MSKEKKISEEYYCNICGEDVSTSEEQRCSSCHDVCQPEIGIDTTSPSWKDGYTQGKKEEGLASLLREKESWERGVEQCVEEVEKIKIDYKNGFDNGWKGIHESCIKNSVKKLHLLLHKK